MALAGLALFGSYAGAQAQSAAGANADQHADPAGYAAVIDEALAEHRGGNFEEARALFAKAHALFPNARTLRGMGMMEFELRDYAASATHLEQALASSVRPLRGELRDSTAVLLARAQGFVGKLSLEVQPASASVLLDGLVVALHPDRPLLLNFGEHVLEVRAPGYLRETRKVTMRSGEEQRLLVELTAAEHGAEPAPEGPGLTNGGRSASQDGGPGALPWVLVGGGGALMIGGGVLLAMSQADIDEVEGASKPATWSSESQDAYDAAPVKSGVGFALLGVGAVSATIGLVWALGGDESDARADRVRVTWSGQRVAIGGRF
jgi:hypothetical protein